MTQNVSAAHAAMAGAITAIGAIWGKLGWLFVLWAACMVFDYLTGSLAALKNGEWDSEVAHAGIWHKAGMICVVLAGMIFDLALGQIVGAAGVQLPISGLLMTPLLLSWYIITELGSIVENAIKMGAEHVPSWLLKGLKIVSDAIDKEGKSKTGGDGNES